jgi:putative SOS response-associated peptidase YedK
MCGRFTLSSSPQAVADFFGLSDVPTLEPRYNVAPTQEVPVIRPAASGRGLSFLRWGLIPSWATDPAIGNRLVNARAETAPEKPAFRAAFRQRRCLVPADGFYEWLSQGRTKQPFYFRQRDGEPFAFAGLWERWHDPHDGVVETCTLLTTDANDVVRPVHDRMPVILPRTVFDRWLDPNLHDPASLEELLRPYPAAQMVGYPVSTWVNNPRHEGPRCVDPTEVQSPLGPLPA